MAKDAEKSEEQVNYERAVTKDVVELLGGLVEPNTIKELVEVHTKEVHTKEVPEKKAPEKKKPEEEVEEEIEEGEEAEQPEFLKDGKKNPEFKKPEEKPVKKEEVNIPENKFGLKVKGKKEEKGKLDIESFEDVPKILKQKYGQDVKEAKDLGKFFETADKWRADSQSLAKVTKEKEDAIATFENLPEELLEAVKAHYRGEDYKETIGKTPKLDFSKSAEKQDIKKLVNAYFPGEFKEEDFEADEKSKELAIAEKASIKQYNTDKTTKEQRAKSEVEKAALKSSAYKTSVSSSVEALKRDFPDMTPDVISDIEETLTSGSLFGKFYNKDGTVKVDAAKRLAMSLHGEDFIGQLMEVARQRGESEANEYMVERANGKKKTGNSGKQEKIRKEVDDTINELIPQGIISKKTF